MFLDIDHFKTINDTHGHNKGDEVLQQFARTLSSKVRNEDTLIRWGGEEFLLLCPNTDLEQACKLAEKLRRCIENEAWPHRQTLTCSFGVAAYSGSDPITLIEQADKALYRAKELGRNQVATANDSGTPSYQRFAS
jgi:diguanylate cyclase (GGDEF)-like protein